MKPLPDHLRSLLAQAAELWAAGNAWEVVAEKLGRHLQTCCRWPVRYPRQWDGQRTARAGRSEGGSFFSEQHVPQLERSGTAYEDKGLAIGRAREIVRGQPPPPNSRGPTLLNRMLEPL